MAWSVKCTQRKIGGSNGLKTSVSTLLNFLLSPEGHDLWKCKFGEAVEICWLFFFLFFFFSSFFFGGGAVWREERGLIVSVLLFLYFKACTILFFILQWRNSLPWLSTIYSNWNVHGPVMLNSSFCTTASHKREWFSESDNSKKKKKVY